MFKKIMSVIAAGAMVLSMSGCGEKDTEDFYSMMTSVSEITNASYKGSITMNDYGKTEYMKVDYMGNVNESGDLALQLGMKVETEEFKTEGMLDILDVVLTGNAVYLNVDKLISSIGSFAGADESGVIEGIAGVNIGADWIKVESGEDLSNEVQSDIAVPDMGKVENSLKASYIPLLTTLNEVLSGIEPAVIGVDGNKYFLHINESNAEAFVTAMDTAFSEGKFDSIIKDIANSMNESEEFNLEATFSELRTMLNKLGKFELRCSIRKSGDETFIDAYFDNIDAHQRIDFNLTLTSSASKIDIPSPEGAITLEEAMSSIMNGMLGGGSMPDIGSDLGIIDGSDFAGSFDFSGMLSEPSVAW